MSTSVLIVVGAWLFLILCGIGCSAYRWWQDLTAEEPDLVGRYRDVWAVKNDDIRHE
jgi:hypothetical protein